MIHKGCDEDGEVTPEHRESAKAESRWKEYLYAYPFRAENPNAACAVADSRYGFRYLMESIEAKHKAVIRRFPCRRVKAKGLFEPAERRVLRNLSGTTGLFTITRLKDLRRVFLFIRKKFRSGNRTAPQT